MDMNKICLTGKLTETPELKSTSNTCKLVCKTSIAVNRMKGKDSEKAECDFISLVAWENTAEFLAKNFVKGSPIGIEGTLRTGNYIDKETNKTVYTTDVLVQNVFFVGYKKDGKKDG